MENVLVKIILAIKRRIFSIFKIHAQDGDVKQ